jgi:hypothetical protein
MKHCNTCNTEKDLTSFGRRSASNDGLSPRCKTCQKVYDKLRANDPYREEARRIYAQTEEGRISGNKAKAEYRKRNPVKVKAHAKVAYAIRSGNLYREPCEVCEDENTHAHHDNYLMPLNIRWLCPKHHNEWHKENGEGKNA